jgi:hypothetical protein
MGLKDLLRLQLAVVCIVIRSKLKGPITGLRLQLAQQPRPEIAIHSPCHVPLAVEAACNSDLT